MLRWQSLAARSATALASRLRDASAGPLEVMHGEYQGVVSAAAAAVVTLKKTYQSITGPSLKCAP